MPNYLVLGIIVGGVGALSFFGGTQLMGRQGSKLGVAGGCLLTAIGALLIFVGFGFLAASLLS
jgi:sulfite exporter TauE/SafE